MKKAMTYIVQFETTSGNLAELPNVYRSEKKVLDVARGLADTLQTTAIVFKVDGRSDFRILNRVAVIVCTDKMKFEGEQ